MNRLVRVWIQRRLFGSPQDAPAPAVSGQSSAAGQQTENKRHQESLPPVTSPPPPPPTQETNSQKAASPPPGPNVGTGQEDTGSQGRREETDKLKEAMEKCDASHKCSSGNEFSACLQVPDNGNALISFGIHKYNLLSQRFLNSPLLSDCYTRDVQVQTRSLV